MMRRHFKALSQGTSTILTHNRGTGSSTPQITRRTIAFTVMPLLPLELCLEVLECSHFSGANHFPDYQTLRNLSLVCRTFGYHAQNALFRNVVVTRRKQALAFLQATDPINERGRSLGAAVRSLTVRVEDRGDRADITCPIFVTVFLRCRSLVELTLRSIHSMEGTRFSEDELETLSMHAPKTLRCIRSHTTPLSYWLVKCCPWVTGVLLGSDLDEFIEEEGHLELYSDNLIEIQWFGSMEHLLKMVTGETNYILDENEMQPHSIQILGLRDALHPDWRRGTDVLQSVGRSLRSLHLAQCDFEYATCIRDHVRNLEELILDVLPAEQLLDALPTTIQHLQITTPNNVVCTSDVDLRHLRHWISVTQSLKVLTWTTQGCSGHGRYEWIDAACKKVGAELHLYRGPFGSFPGEQDELASGPVKSFPRTLVFSPARTNGFKLCYNVEQFVGTIADHHTTKAVEVPNDRPKNPSRSVNANRHTKINRHHQPTRRGHPAAAKTEKSSDTTSKSFVPETASDAFVFFTPQTSLGKQSERSVPSTSPSAFTFNFSTKSIS